MAPLTVLVPLYMYPSPGSWDPLLSAAAIHPHVQFLCIVNPHNGPGAEPLPDANYAAALQAVCALSNVRPLGYVHCTYGKRESLAIKADIDRYAAWEQRTEGRFRVDGIFVDEAPWEPWKRQDMGLLARHIRSTCGLVVYNPGAAVSPGYLEDADFVVVFEQSRQHWYDQRLQQGLRKIPSGLRHKAVAIVHSLGGGEARAATAVADQIRQLGFGGLYITEQVGGGYTQWPAVWPGVVAGGAGTPK